MSDVAYGGRPPGESFLQRLERMMREGQLPDPRTGAGATKYALFGILLGIALGLAGWL